MMLFSIEEHPMAYNEELHERIKTIVSPWKDTKHKNRFFPSISIFSVSKRASQDDWDARSSKWVTPICAAII